MSSATLKISRRGAAHIIPVMIAGSTFMGLVIDGRSAYLNSAWICVLGGFIVSLPAVIIIEKHRWITQGMTWSALSLSVALYMLFQSAAISRLLVNSVSYSNFETVPPILLSAVMMIACLFVISRSSDGIGNASKICGIALLILLFVVIIANAGYMNARWLTPYLSAEYNKLLRGILVTGGYITSAVLIYIPAEKGGPYRNGCIKAVAKGTILSMILCLYAAVMSPMQALNTINRLQAIETLLSNGRTSLGVQLPITLIWFLGYVMVLASYAFSGALFLQQALRKTNSLIIGTVAVAIIFMLANTGMAESKTVNQVNRFVMIGSVIIIATAWIIGRKSNETP